MKKIGFVYKYSPSEEKGILVFGTWKEKKTWCTTIINTPILFSAEDLLSEVSTGQLVYFELEDKKATRIERASLSNFKIDYINSIVRCKENESEYSFYNDNTKISFECLDDIIIPKEEPKQISSETTEGFDVDDFLSEDDFDEYFDLFDFDDSSASSQIIAELDPSSITESSADLPESVTDLFSCFGKYRHKGNRNNDSITIDVFDLSLWIDHDVLNSTLPE